MRWSALLLVCLLPGAQADLYLDPTAPTDPVPLGSTTNITLQVAIDCSDLVLRTAESKARIDLALSHDDAMTVTGDTSHVIPFPPSPCGEEERYTWDTSLSIGFGPKAIGLQAYPLTITASVPNTTVDPVPVAPVDKSVDLRPAYDGRMEINLNGTIDAAGDGEGSISVWLENLSNAETLFKLRISEAGEGSVTLPTSPTLQTPLADGKTGMFLQFDFRAPLDWSGESIFEVDVTPVAASDPSVEGSAKVIELIFAEEGSTASVRDKGSPGPLWLPLAALALALALRRT